MAEANGEAETGEAGARSTRVRILVVDDSAVSRCYVAGVLKQLSGTEVVTAEDGAQALRAISEGTVSIVMLDYEMPDMSGVELLRFVRKSHSAVELPILMLTGHDDREMKVEAFRSGANDYIGKLAEPEELCARVGTQIALLQAHRRLNDARLRRAEHQKFEAIGHLAEGLAHELNTPAQYVQDNLSFLSESFEALSAVVAQLRQLPSAAAERSLIDAVLERIEYDYLVEEVPRCIGESKQGIDHVARVVALVREFARPGLPERIAQSLNEIIRGAAAVTRGYWQQVATLELELSDALPLVQCLGGAIKQVILYALLEAVQAMGTRGTDDRPKGRLRITTRSEPGWALIEIEDNGRGLTDSAVQRVMNPVLGSRANEANQALEYARAVVTDQHRGRVELRSSTGGTTLTIGLPLELVQTDSPDDGDDANAWG